MYPMVDEESLQERVQGRWINWQNQATIFSFNIRKYAFNMVKYYFVKTLSNMSDINIMKKDSSYMFLITTKFKFLDVRNYLVRSLSFDGWCKANGCVV